MGKKRSPVICFAGRSVLLETIASYWPYSNKEANGYTIRGIAYVLRSGEKVTAQGDDKMGQDRAIAFLNKHFKPIEFTAWKCEACVGKTEENNRCGGCYEYNNHKHFERKKNESSTKNVHQE